MSIMTEREAELYSEVISQGHAYEKHVNPGTYSGKNEFAPYGVQTQPQFAEHIEETMCDPKTLAIVAENHTVEYCNIVTNTRVVAHPHSDGGTAFILDPTKGTDCEQKTQERLARLELQYANNPAPFLDGPPVIQPASCGPEQKEQEQAVVAAKPVATTNTAAASTELNSQHEAMPTWQKVAFAGGIVVLAGTAYATGAGEIATGIVLVGGLVASKSSPAAASEVPATTAVDDIHIPSKAEWAAPPVASPTPAPQQAEPVAMKPEAHNHIPESHRNEYQILGELPVQQLPRLPGSRSGTYLS